MNHFDYIFTGAGCSGLSVLTRLITEDALRNKTVLLIDRSAKDSNDRTWCYWEKGEGYFESIVHRSWDKLSVYGNDYAQTHTIHPYKYKMIRGLDFYEHCFAFIKEKTNITILREEVLGIGNTDGKAYATTPSGTFTASYVFNSILFNQPVMKAGQYHLLQHFKGFIIRTSQPSFNPVIATLMDFRISQDPGTSFVYVLPLSDNQALVEYTLFTKDLLTQPAYDKAVHDYVRQVLRISDYDVVSTEFGIIPMTNFSFPTHDGNIIHIGTAGGQTKPSTGYTFTFIQKQANFIVKMLAAGRFPVPGPSLSRKKFDWYDGTLLSVLANKKLPGSFIFTELFRKNRISDVFAFLDNETSLLQDIRVIRVLPKWIFAKAALWK
ncbi:MAG: lycopene cyclase [Chitinophagaceae bacterium]|nr:MAG: lycopene cyclase [Chitinophagaceae bacterium]